MKPLNFHAQLLFFFLISLLIFSLRPPLSLLFSFFLHAVKVEVMLALAAAAAAAPLDATAAARAGAVDGIDARWRARKHVSASSPRARS